MRGIDLEVYGLSVDALVDARHSSRLVLNLPLDIREVVEPPVGDVMKFRPLGAPSSSGRSIGIVERIRGVIVFGDVDELENQRTAGDDAAAAREKVPADNVFKD